MSELYNQINYKLTYYHFLIKDMINSLIIDHNLFDNEIDSLIHMKLDEECLYYKNINIEKITIDNNTLNIINNCIAKIVDRFWYITTYENKSNIHDLRDDEFANFLLIKSLEYDDSLSINNIITYSNNNKKYLDKFINDHEHDKNGFISGRIDFIDEIDSELKKRNVSKDSFNIDKDFYWIFVIELYRNYIKNNQIIYYACNK